MLMYTQMNKLVDELVLCLSLRLVVKMKSVYSVI